MSFTSRSIAAALGSPGQRAFEELQKRYLEEPYVVCLLRPNREHSGALCLVPTFRGITLRPLPEERL